MCYFADCKERITCLLCKQNTGVPDEYNKTTPVSFQTVGKYFINTMTNPNFKHFD